MSEERTKRIRDILQVHRNMLGIFETTCISQLPEAAKLLSDSIRNNGKILICGNGGSAADAQHIAGELIGRFVMERNALPAIALTTDTSIMTAVANDYTFDTIFARQVEGLMQKDDVLWAFSTSGSSKNVILAAKKAKEKNGKILAFTGRENSELEALSDLCICTANDSTARVQELHSIAYHIICEFVEQELCG